MDWQNSSPPSGKSEGQRRGTVKIGPFTKIPSKFFGSGTAASLKPSAALVFVALCEQANRNNSNTFKASDAMIASETGLAPRTICNARKRLAERELVSCSRHEGQSYVYTLPVYSFPWIRLEDRPRQKRKPRAIHATRAGIP
jgi:hypothetical protein